AVACLAVVPLACCRIRIVRGHLDRARDGATSESLPVLGPVLKSPESAREDSGRVSGLPCGAFRAQACRAPVLRIRRRRWPPRVGRENCQSPHSSAAAVLPTSRWRDSSLLRRLLSFARSPRRGKSSPWSCCLSLVPAQARYPLKGLGR